MTIPNIQINSTHVDTIGIFKVNVPEWLTSTPTHATTTHPPATVIIGSPIIDMPVVLRHTSLVIEIIV